MTIWTTLGVESLVGWRCAGCGRCGITKECASEERMMSEACSPSLVSVDAKIATMLFGRSMWRVCWIEILYSIHLIQIKKCFSYFVGDALRLKFWPLVFLS
jgi:hypothetical protein